MTVSEMAAVFGISVRTLHYYDEIGLLRPSSVSEAGYRLYDADALKRLQQILFYRELEFPLSDIAKMLDHPRHDAADALQKHRALLLLKRQHLDELLQMVDDTLGGNPMKNHKTTLQDIQNAKEQYAAEAQQRWGGSDAYRQSQQRYDTLSDAEKLRIAQEGDEIFAAFAALRGESPAAPDAQALVRRWQDHIGYFYTCTDEILAGLGEMYIDDERFTKNIDKFGEGTALLMRDAIRVYCTKQ